MKLYQTIDGTLIGFYRETGGAVQCTMYRDVYEQRLVKKTRQEEVVVAGYFEQVTKTVPGYWTSERQYVQGHYEIKPYWFDEYSVTRYRQVPGHYETQSIWVPAYTVKRYREVPGHYEIQPYWFEEHTITKYYWREAHPARGIEAAWIPYEEVVPAGYSDTRVWVETYTEEYEETIPAGYKDQRVWVDTYTEEYQEIMPAGEKDTRVWVDGVYEDVEVWITEKTITEAVWREPTIESKTVEYQELEEVWVGREPVYEFIDPSQVTLFEVVDLTQAPMDHPELEDQITIRNTLTGEELTTTATFIGLGTRIDENEYVVP